MAGGKVNFNNHIGKRDLGRDKQRNVPAELMQMKNVNYLRNMNTDCATGKERRGLWGVVKGERTQHMGGHTLAGPVHSTFVRLHDPMFIYSLQVISQLPPLSGALHSCPRHPSVM